MNESELENTLRGLRPVTPSPSLEGRIAAALGSATAARRPWALRLGERLLWTAAGAVVAWLILPGLSSPPAPVSTAEAPQVPAAPRVSEVPLDWSDEGVQMVGGSTPARLLRRLVMERHQSPDGSAELRIPREDVILVPVAFH